MKIAFHTLGCKVNQYESEAMKNSSKKKSWEVVEDSQVADIYVINTCTVTNLADRKSRQYIRKMKKVNPDSTIVVTGCYAQVSEDEVANIDGVNLIIGNNNKGRVIDIIEEYINNHKTTLESYVMSREELTDFEEYESNADIDSKTRAFLKIQEGCNRFCSYCIIPFARGDIRSRKEEDIIQEFKKLLSKGFKEIVLTGINTALYEDLDVLLNKLDNIEGDFRIRLSSLEPTVINEEYVSKILQRKKLCKHLHLSLQSGSDKILDKMNRSYTRAEYLSIVRKLQEYDEFYGITTDIIVGFPYEDEQDFKDTVELVEKVNFCRVHTFKYSKRKGTKAAQMPNQVPENIKKERIELLMNISKDIALRFANKNIGREETVLFEEEAENNIICGYTDNYIKAYLFLEDEEEKRNYIGNLVSVKIVDTYLDGVRVII